MVYADKDFWIALMKQDDWLKERAEKLLEDYESIEVSLVTFIELCLILDRYDVDKETAVAEILEMADSDVDEEAVFQALEYMEEGLNTFDAFHAAKAGEEIISSDREFGKIDIDRIRLEEG